MPGGKSTGKVLSREKGGSYLGGGRNQWRLFQALHLRLRLEALVGVTKQKPLCASISSSTIWGDRAKFSSSSKGNYSLNSEIEDLSLPGKQM